MRNRAEPASILVLQFRTLGDVVLTTALLDNLKRHFPGVRLAILAVPAYRELLRLCPEVEFIPYHRRKPGSRDPLRGLRGWIGPILAILVRRFDWVIDLSDTRRGAALATISLASVRVGFRPANREPTRAFTYAIDEFNAETHYLDRYLSPLKALGLPVLTRTPHLRASHGVQERVAQTLRHEGLVPQRYIVVHVGARVASRAWPPERFAAVIDAVEACHGLRVVLIGAAEDKAAAGAVQVRCRSAPLNWVGLVKLEELVAVLTDCALFIGNDSGPMHLAAASGSPVVALFGLQSPARWGPSGERHVVVRPSMPCPCPYPDVCRPPDTQATLCVRRIGVDEVLAAIAAVLQRAS